MSVYKPKKSRFYQYDFVQKGRRFHGSTGQETRRAAEAVERKFRLDAAEGRLDEPAQLTLDQAAGRYWLEHCRHRGDAAQMKGRIARLLELIPKTMRLAEITTAVVSAAMQKRRSQPFRKSPKKGAKLYMPTNGAVNRDVIQVLRPILNRARVHWEAKGLPEINWKALTLPVPRETIRVYSDAEREDWAAENGPTAALALRLLMRYGLRFGELFFHPHAFEPAGPRLGWYKGRKKDVWHTVPLLTEDADEIAARVGRAVAAGLDTIWYVEEVDSRGNVTLRPLTYYGLQSRLRSSSKRAKIPQGRVIHGARHHAGTTVQRTYKNSKVTQRLLGHLDPRSTDRYIHAMEDEVLAALQEVESSRNSPEPTPHEEPKTKAG